MTVKHITLRIEQFTKDALKYLLKKTKRFTAWFRGNIKQILILLFIALIGCTLLYCGYKKASPEDFNNEFTLPASYTLLALVPGLFFVDTVSKRILKLRERIDYGLKNKRILLAGDKAECNNVEAQLHYSQLFNKNNITNDATLITPETPKYSCDFNTFTEYDLVILCFIGKNRTAISNEQAQLLSDTLTTIGHDERVKNDIEVNNSDEAVVGLIVLCPLGSLQDPDEKNKLNPEKHKWDTNPFKRPFTAVVNQAGRLLTDVFSLLTTLPPRSGE